jgi:hypothetical protein
VEAILTMDTPLHAAHQLDQLAGQFAHWRQHRSHPHERIPAPLWDQAVALTAPLSASRVAKHGRLGGQDRTRQRAKRQGQAAAARPSTPGCVAVPRPRTPPQGVGSLEVALHRPAGARLHRHAPDAELPLTAIIHRFLAVRCCSRSPPNAASVERRNRSIAAQGLLGWPPSVGNDSAPPP